MNIIQHVQVFIGKYEVKKIESIRIEKNLKTFTDTCHITMPKHSRFNNQDAFTEIESTIFKKGDDVEVWIWYTQGARVLPKQRKFSGFIDNFEMGQETVKIVCEDGMYFIKQTEFDISFKQISLKDLGNYMIAKVNKKYPKAKLSVTTEALGTIIYNLSLEKCTGMEILKHLQSRYTLDSYFIGNVLHIGINYQSNDVQADLNSNKRKLHYFTSYPASVVNRNTKKNYNYFVEFDNLRFQKLEDAKFTINVKVHQTDGKMKQYTFGDTDGEVRDVIMFGSPTQSEIEKFVENQLKRFKYEGFQRGSYFESLLNVDANPLDIVTFDGVGYWRYNSNPSYGIDQVKMYETGSYLIESVTIFIGQGESYQKIQISNNMSVRGVGESLVDKLEKGTLVL